MDESLWTDEQKHAYQRALTWGEEQLLPPPVRQAFAVWHAKIGHHMFIQLDKAFRWFSAERPQPEQEDN